jgi:DNA-binding beta-propeller fold protein YncE
VANGGDATVSRIDPGTDEVTVIEIGNRPDQIAISDGAVWVTVQAP